MFRDCLSTQFFRAWGNNFNIYCQQTKNIIFIITRAEMSGEKVP